MGVIDNYNRVISIYFFSRIKKGESYVKADEYSEAIICPENGRKPSIVINGLSTQSESVPMFNITIKNLYMDDIASRYPYIEVEAGYKGKTQRFSATILYAFTESPGPEGQTVIQCIQGNADSWLSSTVKISLKEGSSLNDAVNVIAKALGANAELSEKLKSITLNDPFIFEGKAKDAIAALKNHFTKEINIKLQGNTLTASLNAEDNGDVPIEIPFLTTPAQLVGGENRSVLATITSLWNPEVKPGVKVKFNAAYYSTKGVLVNKSDELVMTVNTVQFQFATAKGGNQMTVTGQIL